MAKIDDIKDREGGTIYPRTVTSAVYEAGTNKRLDTTLTGLESRKMNKSKITISSKEADASLMDEMDIWIKYE